MRRLLMLSVMVLAVVMPVMAQELAEIDALVEPSIGDDAPGMAVLVMQDGVVLHSKGYGFADIEEETPVTAQSIFDLASVSKQFTAQAAMLLVQDGLLNPDTEIAELLPEFAERDDARPLVVADLVHHVSGLPDYLNDDDFAYDSAMDNDDVLDWLGTAPTVRAPGTAFDYSNSGYLTLASVVAAADGAADLAEVLSERIFEPLGMAHTGVVTPADPMRLVTGYAGTGGDFTLSSDVTVTQGDGNVYTSIADLALYEQALATDALLSPDLAEALFSNGLFDSGKPISDEDGDGYGYGWHLTTVDGAAVAFHDGSWYGTATGYYRNLDSGLTVIVLCNGEDFDPLGLAGEISALFE